MKLLRKIKKAFILIGNHPRGFKDYYISRLCAFLKIQHSLGLPVHIAIEPTNTCNLHCPLCLTGSETLNRQKGMMSLDDFKLIVDKISYHTNRLFLYYRGEPFLNSEYYEMVRYAKDKGLYVHSCTNGHFLDAEKLINSGIDEIIIHIGGVRQETHQIYRKGGNLENVLKNIEQLVKKKSERCAINAKVILGFIVMKHNESEIDGFLKLAQKLKVDEARIISPRVPTFEKGKVFLPRNEKYWLYDKIAFEKGILRTKRIPSNICYWIYLSIVILCNGDIIPCCRDPRGEFVMGNILKEDLKDVWNGEKYRKFRKQVATQQKKLSMCRLCTRASFPQLYTNRGCIDFKEVIQYSCKRYIKYILND